jgi:hypothetical protein
MRFAITDGDPVAYSVATARMDGAVPFSCYRIVGGEVIWSRGSMPAGC